MGYTLEEANCFNQCFLLDLGKTKDLSCDINVYNYSDLFNYNYKLFKLG